MTPYRRCPVCYPVVLGVGSVEDLVGANLNTLSHLSKLLNFTEVARLMFSQGQLLISDG